MFYILFAAQLILNFLWTPLFFGHGHMELAMVDLVAMWVIVLVMIYLTWSRGLEVAAYLLIPYIVWLTFAGYLNAGAIYLN
ncbi:MAG: tryptophan-rich sensory protein [Candidatus Methanomethylophilaceae archaeon]|nr:tryptophan-rich sensory protein [Candidatus Methanomethylophilaceae archaeon]